MQAYLDGEVASVYVVSKEEVASIFWGSPYVKQLHEVIELSVDITADSDRSLHC